MMALASWLQRPVAILATLALICVLPPDIFDLFTYATLLAHYFIALKFHPWAKISGKGMLGPHLLVASALVAVGLMMFYSKLPGIVLYFGLHFVLTEVYENGRSQSAATAFLRGIYYSSFYLFFMKFNLGIESLAAPILYCVLSSLALLAFRERDWRRFLVEACFLLPLLLSFHQPMKTNYVLSYHVMVWWAIPMMRGYTRAPTKYLSWSAGVTFLSLAVVFATYTYQSSFYWLWWRETIRFGYIHISLSFLMSSLNPLYIRNGFMQLQGQLRNVF